MQIYYKI